MARILIIDDDPSFLTMLRHMLESKGYEVISATDGNMGIRMYKEKGADLVITDIIMPEKEGMETISDLCEENPDVKIIAISGGGSLDPDNFLEMAPYISLLQTNYFFEIRRSPIGFLCKSYTIPLQ